MLIGFAFYFIAMPYIAPKYAPTIVKADPDNDGLTNDREIELGTDPEDLDTDNDGLKDGEEVDIYNTSPVDYDTDGDGLGDGEEIIDYGTNPRDIDSDDDGLKDGEEIMSFKTDPLKADTDEDRLSDREEIMEYNTNPLRADTDNDKLSDYDEVRTYKTDPLDADTDHDGLLDGEEIMSGTNPLNPDTDDDGYKDGEDLFPLFDAVLVIDVDYWKEYEFGDAFNNHGDPYLIITIHLWYSGDWHAYTSTELTIGSNIGEAYDNYVAPVTINIPDDIRRVFIEITAWDSDRPWSSDDPYDINGDPKYAGLGITYDVLSGSLSIEGNGNADGDDPDYLEAYIVLTVSVESR